MIESKKHMSTTNPFSDYYKTIPNSELLEIIENPGNYQDIAVEAATLEFRQRDLSDAQISEAKDVLVQQKQNSQRQLEKIKSIETSIIGAGATIVETFNPIHESALPTDKLIRLISFTYAGFFLYDIIQHYKWIIFYLTYFLSHPVLSLSYLIPLFLIPFAAYYFYKRKTMGWILLAAFVTFSTVFPLFSLYQFFKSDHLFGGPSATFIIFQLIFLFGTLIIICRMDIRQIFKITNQKMINTILATNVLALVFLFLTSVD